MKPQHIAQNILGLILLISATFSCAEGETSAPPAPPPPCSSEPYRQFDFWLGKWTVSSATGQFQGNNHLHKMFGDCGMQENWRGSGGLSVGSSYNFYDAGAKVWRQTWVDNQGGSLLLSGGLVGNSMQLSGERPSAGDKKVIDRITWTPLPDGRVRQHWQVSEDGGQSWSDLFDGYYARDTSEAP